jgi:hypothetical protein
MIRGTERSRDSTVKKGGRSGKKEVQNVLSLVGTIGNVCGNVDDLAEVIRDGEIPGLTTAVICPGRTKPLGVMNIEVTEIHHLGPGKLRSHRVVTCREMLEKFGEICMLRGTID